MRKLIVTLVASLALAQFSNAAFAQQGAHAEWGGWARCEVRVQGPGYNDQQTHTWTITSGAPAVQGAFHVYTGTWAVVGSGSLSRSQGTQTLMAQWATNGPGVSAPIAVFVRASDNRMFIQARHAQLRSNAAIQGYQQVTVAGRPQTPARIDAAAFEWAFPVVAVSAPVAPDRNATASGSSTAPVNGSVGLMQPAGSQGTASCTWQFGQGAAAPAPPPTLSAQAIPTPGSPATVIPPANNPPVASTPPENSTPPTTPPGTTPLPDNPPGSTTPPAGGARLVSVSQTTLEQGAIGTVMTLTGQGTHWSQSRPSVVLSPDIGVPVTNAQASSDTELLVALDVQYATAPGARTITVTAGSEVVTLPNAFTVTARARPELVSVTPLRARQGDRSLTVRMTGRNTRWVQGATRVQVARAANASQPGTPAQMPGVTVVSTTVHSPTSASAVLNVEADAVVGAYWFQVFDAAPSDWLKIVDGFTVESAPSRPPVIHVEFPNGGESFTAGSFDSYDVIWTHTYPAGQLFDVDFSLDGGRTWLRYDSNQARSSTDLILHAHPELQPTTTALVRVSPAGNSAVGDMSDAPFTIAAPASSTPVNPPIVATPLDPALLPLPVFCTLRGPAQSSAYDNYATPGAAHLDWEPVAGVREYTVSRSDLGVVSSRPLPASETSFVHLAMLPHPGTYVYTITANYREGGCGATNITLSSQLPATPDVWHRFETQAGAVRLTWDWPVRTTLERVVGDYTGVLITGPALPAAGREVLRRSMSGDNTVINGVAAGSRTWTVKTFWDTPTGRLIDNTGKTITVLVP